MAGRGMSLASIISASQSGAAQAMSMAEEERNKNPDYQTPGSEKEELDPGAKQQGQGEQAFLNESMLLNSMDIGTLMVDSYKDASMISTLIGASGPNTQGAFAPLNQN